MNVSCDLSHPWHKGDFVPCFREIVFDVWFILLGVAVSLTAILLRMFRHRRPALSMYAPLQNDSSAYGATHDSSFHDGSRSGNHCSSTSSRSTVTRNQPSSKWTLCYLTRVILTSLQLVLCVVALWLHNVERFPLDEPVEHSRETLAWAYTIRTAFWIYLLALLLFSEDHSHSEYPFDKTLSRSAASYSDGLVLLAFVINLISLRSYFLAHDINNFSPGYIFCVGSTGITAALLVIIANEERNVPSELMEGETDRILSGEKRASIYSKLMFSWLNVLFKKGFKRTLDDVDLLELSPENRAQQALAKYRLTKTRSMAWSLLVTFRWPLARQCVFCIAWSIFMFGPPYYLHKIIKYTENSDPSHQDSIATALLYVIGLFVTSLAQSLAYQQVLYIGRTLAIRIKSIVIGEVYAKTMRRKEEHNQLSGELDKKETRGNVNNLLSVDAQKLGETAAYVFLLYCFPIQISICTWSLYQLLGTASIYVILVMALSQPVVYLLSRKYQRLHHTVMACTDVRIRLMNELLAGICIVKLFAWEEQFQTRVNSAREVELKAIKARLLTFMWMGNVWFLIPMLTMVTVFYVYTKTAILTASTAFTALALFSTFKTIVNQIPSVTSFILQANVSVRRIEKFLAEPEVELPPQTSSSISLGFIDRATFSWKPLPDGEPVLHDLDLDFPLYKLSIVCGPTGSGKTTLLASLLGETYCLAGAAVLPRKSRKGMSNVAYVAQTAWLQNCSIKDSILFGLPYDADRYASVLYMTALTHDLDTLQYGDSTEVGEKGIALSGGQKQRVSIARAVYSQAETVILDDCLSAVDAHTAEHLYEHCLTGKLMKHRTVILVTHHVGLCIKGAAYVVVLQDGRVVEAGKPSKVIRKGILGESLGRFGKEQDLDRKEQNAIEQTRSMVPKTTNVPNLDGSGKLTQQEKRAEGNVSMAVYATYYKASGGVLFWILVLLLFCLAQTSILGQDYWIKTWTSAYSRAGNSIHVLTQSMSIFATSISALKAPLYDHLTEASPPQSSPPQSVNVSYYIGIYFLIGILSLLMISLRSIVLFTGSLRASRRLHGQLLEHILHAKVRFFDTTPLGRIINRFSSDLETIDQAVAPALSDLFYSIIAAAYIVILITIITPVFVIPGTLIATLFWAVGNYYLCTARDLKRLNSVSRSPIYVQFNESIQGVATIRAYGCQQRFIAENFCRIDNSNRPYIWMWATNRWLHCRVDLLGALVGLCTGGALIMSRSWIDPSLAGLSLNYALTFTYQALMVVRLYAFCEMNGNAIERVREYLDLEQEPSRLNDGQRIRPTWPETGAIQVEDLVVKYCPEDPPALKGLSFTTRPSEKIGIVGRTGSGKTTLALSIFRFMEAHSGRILIDGVDTATLGLDDLRSRLSIIPQDPVLFSGTLRSNLDPFGRYDDIQLWKALKRVHLTDHEVGISGKVTLDAPVAENGSNWSQGQRQLIALARALIKKSSLIVLDEATSSVDFDTDHRVQQTIRSEFVGSSLLCIAHRLRTVVDYDRILVLDQGQVIEFDTPYALMMRHGSAFHQMCERSGEFVELLEIARAKHISVK